MRVVNERCGLDIMITGIIGYVPEVGTLDLEIGTLTEVRFNVKGNKKPELKGDRERDRKKGKTENLKGGSFLFEGNVVWLEGSVPSLPPLQKQRGSEEMISDQASFPPITASITSMANHIAGWELACGCGFSFLSHQRGCSHRSVRQAFVCFFSS
ncbi:hypothetical protein AXF42_Ash006351 [Apostasia shenzhenica]|uniref:Uncharacterized protein n=1 Tax=Apostasia shenzhenica TaxID=1088818 RepID=A0A2I0AYT9_9ASPA|nr:hypothetical protein AXF42_Ash006351 [Apostasia shenzhenica]